MSKKDARQPDLIWFDYETRLRTLVEELLEPTLRRSREERELFEILNKKNDHLGKRLDDLEFMFQKTQKRQTAFEDIFKRLHDIDTSRKAEDKELSDRIDAVKKNVEELNTDMFLLKESMNEQERKGQKLSDEFVTTTDHLAEYKTNLNKVVYDLNQSWKTQVEEQQVANKETLGKIHQANDKLTELGDALKNHDHQLDAIYKNIDQLSSKTVTLDGKIAKNNEHLESYSHQASFVSTFKPRLDHLEKQLCTDEKYIEQYLPLFLQVQIADTLHGSLHPNDLRRHAVHEQKTFQELIDSLKTTEPPNLGRRIEKLYEKIDPTIKKYAQEAIHGKKNESGITRSADFQGNPTEEFHDEAVDYRILADLNRKVTQIQTESDRNMKESRDEFSRRFLLLTKEQVEVTESVNTKLENLRSELEKMIEAGPKSKERQSQEESLGFQQTNEPRMGERTSSSLILGEKTKAFLRCLSEMFATSVDTVNGMLATLLREERDRELVLMDEQERPLAYSQMVREIITNKKTTQKDKMKRSTEAISAQGTREDMTSESPTNPREGIRQTNPETISKIELLMIMFENFKPCLSFAMKLRVATDFMQFFDAEANRYIQVENRMRKEGSQTLNAGKLSSEERPKERSITPQMKSRIVSRANSMSNKSSLVDITPGTSFEKKPGGISSISKV